MEEKNKSNSLTTITIVVLVILVISLAGLITYDKVLNKNSKCVEAKEELQETDNEKEVVKEECPLEKFNNDYTLTATDKEEIAKVIVSSPGFENVSKDKIVEILKITNISSSGYFFSAGWNEDKSIGGGNIFFYIAKVNGKFKIIGGGGSGDDANGYKRMENTINNLCS